MNFTGIDPIALAEWGWPDTLFYGPQKDILYSLRDDDETVVPAGNMLGKDFIAGYAVVWFFLTRHPCRIVTTSAKDDHLRVLWGEIGDCIRRCKYNLDWKHGGPLVLNHHNITKIVEGAKCPLSYITGLVANDQTIAAMQGHHIANTGDGVPRTLFVVDEASSVNNAFYTMGRTWANRILIIGNTWPCTNFFYKAVKGDIANKIPGGNLPREDGSGYYRRVIRIRAKDSPNVRLGMIQEAKGSKATDEIIIPGVKSYKQYKKELVLWDPIQKCVSHDADFYEGDEIKLYPLERLTRANERAKALRLLYGHRAGRAIGVDPAEGGDNTVWTVGDSLGFIKQIVKRTADTSVIVGDTIALLQEYKVDPVNVLFDRGGGGKEHADIMRREGYAVRTVGFGETVTPEKKRGLTTLETRKLEDEERYTYFNRRAEMYGLLSNVLDPARNEAGFGIPEEMVDLMDQMRVIPKLYDKEGRLWLPPKHKPPTSESSTVKTMVDMIGHSPDELDSAVLCYYGLVKKARRPRAGAA